METTQLPQPRAPRIQRTAAFKADLVSRALQPGALPNVVAEKAGVHPALLRRWIRESRPQTVAAPSFAKVVVDSPKPGIRIIDESLIPVEIMGSSNMRLTLHIPLTAAAAFTKAVLL